MYIEVLLKNTACFRCLKLGTHRQIKIDEGTWQMYRDDDRTTAVSLEGVINSITTIAGLTYQTMLAVVPLMFPTL